MTLWLDVFQWGTMKGEGLLCVVKFDALPLAWPETAICQSCVQQVNPVRESLLASYRNREVAEE